MIFAVDVYYNGNIAQAACIAFKHWTDERPNFSKKELIINVEPYQPGEFFKRELPCILKVLKGIDQASMDVIVVDGYVFLDDDKKPGLGAHLSEALGSSVPVIGVAKAKFGSDGNYVREVLRGNSQQPLYITSVGLDLDHAAEQVRNMHGPHRIPTLLKQLDFLSRQ